LGIRAAILRKIDGEPEIRGVLEQAGMIYLSPIVLGEYRFGILASLHRVEYERELEGMESEVPCAATG